MKALSTSTSSGRSASESLDLDTPLAVAMTRPTMIGGFTLSSIGISLFLPLYAALILRTVWPLAAAPVLLAVCYLICLKDIYLFDIALSAMRLKACVNKKHWGCRCYAPR